jgi:hypothetical protein
MAETTETESMAGEWEKWLALERANVETLQKRLKGLSSNHDRPEGFRHREFWAEASEISGLLETLTPLPPGEKEKLQTEYDRICRETKRRQEKEQQTHREQARQVQEKREREWKGRRAQSKQMRDSIEAKIQEALASAESVPEDIATLTKAQSSLKEALVLLKGEREGPDATDKPAETVQVNSSSSLLREDEQACWEKWRTANDSIFARRKALWDRSYSQLQPESKAALNEASTGDPFQALEKVKEAQSHLKESPLNKSQREEIKSTLNSAWDMAIAKVNGIRETKRKKHEDWLGRMRIQVERWANVLQENKEEISELEGQIKRHQAEIKAARSPEYSDTLRNLVKEKHQKIREIKESGKELEERISSVREKLSKAEKKQPVKPAKDEAEPDAATEKPAP